MRSNQRDVERVFFVGAGFSKAMGYPLGDELLPELVLFLQKLSKSQRRRIGADVGDYKCATGEHISERAIATLVGLSEFLATQFGVTADLLVSKREVVEKTFRRVGITSFFNLIQVLSDSEIRIRPTRGSHASRLADANEYAARKVATDPRLLYDYLKAALRSYFVQLSQEHTSFGDLPADVRSLLKHLRPTKDVVVSFNWDCEIDFFLWERGRGGARSDISFTFGDWKSSVKDNYLILKPHGSITWYTNTSGIWSNVNPIAGADDRLKPEQRRLVSYYVEDELPEDRDGHRIAQLDIPPAITPPTFAKRFDTPEQRLIWADVVSVCRSAQEIVFLGYRVPEDDFLTAAAVRSALVARRGTAPLKCLVVLKGADPEEIEPYEGYRKAFQSIFGDLALEPRHFLDWTFGEGEPRKGVNVSEFYRLLCHRLRSSELKEPVPSAPFKPSRKRRRKGGLPKKTTRKTRVATSSPKKRMRRA